MEFTFIQIKGQILFKREIIPNVKIGWDHLKVFLFRTTCSISTRLGINHTWRERV
jgi:hypothetical protein